MTRTDGTVIYSPFPDYEVEDPPTGANIIRTTYRVAGQIAAVQTKVGSAAGVFRYTYTDHLGNIVALSQGNNYVGGSLARYDPFGNYRTTPDSSVNPDISNHGFTGHRMNNTGEFPIEKVGLIYMNARYYLPEIGRFISPDTIVPDPGNPQSYNRYSYTRNNPVNFTDPSGHRECELVCEGDLANQQELQFGSAYGGDWDPDQQAANAEVAETVLVDVPQAIVGFFWEPADWGFALSDGFQWYDSIGMLPFIPATVGRYGDDIVPIAQRAAGGTGRAYDRLNGQGLYALLDASNNVQYVGRGDIPARFAAHGKDPIKSRLRQEVVANNNLTYAEARGLEQLVIDVYHPSLNRINGIASSNPAGQGYINAASSLFKDVKELIDGWIK